MSAVDWVLLGVVALSALMGAMRGIVVEVLSLVVWIAAFWLAFGYGVEVAGLFFAQMHDPAARLLVAYAAVFIAALIVGSLVTWLIGKLVRTVGLGGIDRLLGLLFGVVRGCALACMLVLLLGLTALPREPSWHASPLIPQFQHGAEWMKAWLPASAAQHVNFDAVAEQGKKKVVQTLAERVLQASPPAVSQGDDSPGEDAQPS
ncbi:MAG TPA: CvpA family protein, partial [Xanthomonadaceae bacterium]|nr:CvpA family protein [Xanthomonadaceae bacterium]